MIKYYGSMIFLLILGACQKKDDGLVELRSNSDLHGVWMHSFEEDTQDAQVYRKEGFAFPPARGREGFELGENGKLTYYAIAPADGNDAYEGSWVLKEGLLEFSLPEPLQPKVTLKVLELKPDKLVVKEN